MSKDNPTHGRILGAMWSRYPVEARCVEVVVGLSDWGWCKPLLGSIRRAIEVRLADGGMPLYVDNDDGWALSVFLKGKAPLPGFRFLPAFRVYADPAAKSFYQSSP